MLTCFRILVVDHVEVFGHTVKSCAWKSIKFCCAVAVCFASASGRSQTACRNVGKSVPHHTCTRMQSSNTDQPALDAPNVTQTRGAPPNGDSPLPSDKWPKHCLCHQPGSWDTSVEGHTDPQPAPERNLTSVPPNQCLGAFFARGRLVHGDTRYLGLSRRATHCVEQDRDAWRIQRDLASTLNASFL